MFLINGVRGVLVATLLVAVSSFTVQNSGRLLVFLSGIKILFYGSFSL